jgi:hypothetical protein
MQYSWSSLLHWEAAVIRIGLAQLRFPYHTTYAGLGLDPHLHTSTLTWILQNRNRSSTTQEHSTHFTMSFVPNGFTGVCYTVLPPSLHSPCAVIISHKVIAQMLDLPEYVASTTNHDHKNSPDNERSLINSAGSLLLASNWAQAHIPSGLDLKVMIILILQV